MKFAKKRLLTLTQQVWYKSEYDLISNSKQLPDKNQLKTLNPFIDSDGILRVNGRLSESSLSYSERFPIILPGKSHFCHLYLSHLHITLLHAECNLMYRISQTEFYLTRMKPRIKKNNTPMYKTVSKNIILK